MPWDLHFPVDTLDARVEYRGVLALLREHPEVAHLSLPSVPSVTPRPTTTVTVRVFLRGEREEEDAPPVQDRWLQRIHDQYDQPVRREPPPTMEGRFLSVPYRYGDGEPNQNGDVFPRPTLPPPGITPEVQNRILSEYLRTSGGRERLAASMVAPLRERRDYQSVARRTFLVEQLPQGALPIYDQDPGIPRMVIPEGPPREPPMWVQLGAWGFCAGKDEYFEVLERTIHRGEVRIRPWRSSEVRTTDVDWLYEKCVPCEKPEDPRPIWDRLLGDDAF